MKLPLGAFVYKFGLGCYFWTWNSLISFGQWNQGKEVKCRNI